MKPQLLKVPTGPQRSFSVRRDLEPDINNRWHLHEELELIYFKSGEGIQFIGDSVSRFKSGDVVLVGSSLPHYWKFADPFFSKDSGMVADVRVAHFLENFLGNGFFDLPENEGIRDVFEKAKRGLKIEGAAQSKIIRILERLSETDGSDSIVLMLEALAAIPEEKKCTPISSVSFESNDYLDDNDRIQAIFDYSVKNFKHKIKLEEIAAVANISPASFCRYFKSRTRKTYSQYLIELRVKHACKMLIETTICLKRICFESGFNNFTSFHKYFKTITGRSPLAYQREFLYKG